MKALTKIIIITLALIISWGGHTLTGQINVGVSGTPSVVNAYYPVTAISGNTITIGAGTGIAHTLAANDRVLLIQMTGNTAQNGGKFEYAIVTSVAGSSITLSAINRTYTPTTEKVQLVWVPYNATSITVIANILALDWDGTTGGIVSLMTPGNLILNGSILANGAGFKYANGTNTINGSNIYYGGGGGGYLAGGGGGGGFGSGGGGGAVNAEAGNYSGGNPSSLGGTLEFSGGGGGGGGVSSAGAGGGGGSHGGGGGGGAGYASGGCGGAAGDDGGSGGVGSIAGVGDTNGTADSGIFALPSTLGGGGGGGRYVGGGGGGEYPTGLGGASGSNGGAGGLPSGGAGGGSVGTYHNYQNCDAAGTCSDPRLWMGGGSQNATSGGGIVAISANSIAANAQTIAANGDNGSLYLPLYSASGGEGGGGGGLVVVSTNSITGGLLTLCAKGGDGSAGTSDAQHGGGSGGAGGSGLVWINNPLGGVANNNGGSPPVLANVSFCNLPAVPGAATPNPKTASFTGVGGCGGSGAINVNPNGKIFEVVQTCSVSLSAIPSACNLSTNQYSVTGQLTFSNAPATGTLTVSIGAVTRTFTAPFTSPQAYTLTGLTADGASHTVTAAFSDDAACTDAETYTAPVSCQCVISNITATPGACSTTNNTYTLTGQVTFTNAPVAGTLVISVTGGNSVTLTAPFTSPMSYSISNLNADGASHTVTATFSNDILCTSTQTYTAPAQCSTPCPPSNFNFCTGDSYTLTAPAGYSGYQWYTVVGMTETPIPGAMSNVYVATMPGTYIYRATDAGACPIDLCCPVTLNDVRPLLSCTATVTPACGQSNGSATVTAAGGAGGYTYRWSTTPQQTTATATNLAVGTYTVTVTDSGGCSNTCNVVLAPPNSPTCVASVQSNPGCGLMNGSATVAPSGGNGIYTYRWSTTPAQTAQTATGLGAGIYTVTVTDGNQCSSTCSVTLTTPSGPTCSIAANTQPSCANLTGGSATASGVGGSGSYSYAWSNNMSGATVSGLAGGTYTVTITDSNNCSSTCQVTITTPQNCCNVNAVTIQNIACYDNNTPSKMTDNQLRAALLVTNSNASLTTYNVTVNGGTTITPTSGTYGIGTQFTLGPGTAGGGSTFTVTITDSANPGCQNTVQLVDPGNCAPGEPECPPVKCGTATIQVNGN